jgi:dolichol-phosphate mannosyltransferase
MAFAVLDKTTVVIPTYNESGNIPPLVDAIFEAYPGISMLVVDDHSPDGTAELVRGLRGRYPNLGVLERRQNRGFGRSYVDGFRQVLSDGRTEAVVMMDADFSHDPATIGDMVRALGEYGAVVGSRYRSGGNVENWSKWRQLLSRSANFYVRAVLTVPVADMTTGFMAIRTEALRAIDIERLCSDGYSFLVELKYLLARSGCRVYEHPITFRERREGQSKMSGKIIWESIWLPWRIRLR